MIIVTSYTNPDLDGVGGAVGYAELLRHQGKDAAAAVHGTPYVEAQWVLENFRLPPVPSTNQFDVKNTDIVLVDTCFPDNLDPNIRPEQVIEIIDHRDGGKADSFPNAKVQIELVGAAATLVAERLHVSGIQPTKSTALLLLGGIISNTMNFCSLNTTERDHAMKQWLIPIAEPPADFARQMFTAKSQMIFSDLEGAIRSDAMSAPIKDSIVIQGQLELVGVGDLLVQYHDKIQNIMQSLKKESNASYMLLSLVDLDTKTTDILVFDTESAKFYGDALEKLDIRFTDGRAHLDHILLRKQMMPLIRSTLQGK